MTRTDIDALARLLDGDLDDTQATDEARALGMLAKALDSAATAPRAPQMSNRLELRAALVEAAREQQQHVPFLSRLRGTVDDVTARVRYSMRVTAATGAAAMALSTGGTALAAHRSMPSDPLYGVKLALEDARLAFIGDEVARGEQLLSYAVRRMQEAEAMAALGDMDAAAKALAESDTSSREAAGYIIRAAQERGEPQLLDVLDEFTQLQQQRLTDLLPLLGGGAVAAAEDALVVLRRIGQRVTVLTGPCGECEVQGGGVDAASFDFAEIPPASEPFAACPCVTDEPAAGKAGKAGKQSGAKAGGKKAGDTAGKAGGKTGGTAGTATGDSPTGGETGTGTGGDLPTVQEPNKPSTGDNPLPKAPKPVQDAKDEVEDVVKDVLKNPPVDTSTPLPLPKLSPTPLPKLPAPDLQLP
ncbi:MAG TPA: DUF5667 domain-containing protein [Egibacteraceae bacterium]|nr:DUF5667 domain-containing protein [Egibacteraceae bacterium]